MSNRQFERSADNSMVMQSAGHLRPRAKMVTSTARPLSVQLIERRSMCKPRVTAESANPKYGYFVMTRWPWMDGAGRPQC